MWESIGYTKHFIAWKFAQRLKYAGKLPLLGLIVQICLFYGVLLFRLFLAAWWRHTCSGSGGRHQLQCSDKEPELQPLQFIQTRWRKIVPSLVFAIEWSPTWTKANWFSGFLSLLMKRIRLWVRNWFCVWFKMQVTKTQTSLHQKIDQTQFQPTSARTLSRNSRYPSPVLLVLLRPCHTQITLVTGLFRRTSDWTNFLNDWNEAMLNGYKTSARLLSLLIGENR